MNIHVAGNPGAPEARGQRGHKPPLPFCLEICGGKKVPYYRAHGGPPNNIATLMDGNGASLIGLSCSPTGWRGGLLDGRVLGPTFSKAALFEKGPYLWKKGGELLDKIVAWLDGKGRPAGRNGRLLGKIGALLDEKGPLILA